MMHLASCSNGSTAGATIKLFCPSVSSSTARTLVYFPVPFSAGEGGDDKQGIDIGAIARSFRLQASTVRLNGHFLGTRAPDHVSSVTWKALLSFFSARGFPTGSDDGEPIVVHGKPDAQVTGEQLDAKVPPKRKRIVECDLTSLEGGDDLSNEGSILCMKRKLKLEDDHSFKKKRISELDSGFNQEKSTSVPKVGFTYNCSGSGPRKRPREDEMMISTLPSKRTA